jgi:hypothetical protein
VKPERVVYVKSDGNYSTMVLHDKTEHVFTMNLAHCQELIEKQLGKEAETFIRIGKQLIINRDYIFKINVNSQVLIMSDQMNTANELYYAAPTGQRSAELTEFGYKELCMMLDYFYGLKDAHKIESFDKLFHSVTFDRILKDIGTSNAIDLQSNAEALVKKMQLDGLLPMDFGKGA